MTRRCFAVLFAIWWALVPARAQQRPGPLPGTTLWDFPNDIAAEQYRELRAFYEQRMAEAERERQQYWQAAGTIEANREELRRTIGAIDKFQAPKPERTFVGETGAYRVSLVKWPLMAIGTEAPTGLSGRVHEYGLLLEPNGSGPFPAVVAVADANNSATDIAGLTGRLSRQQQFAGALASRGYVVFAPFFIRRRAFSEPWIDDRTWLMRLAYQVGRHIVGTETEQVSSALDFLGSLGSVDRERLAVAGFGQGGMTAFYSAALDRRVRAALVAGYCDEHRRVWEEPEDRTLWKHLMKFGDAEIARLVAPASLIAVAELSDEALVRIDQALRPAARSGETSGKIDFDPLIAAQIENASFTEWQAYYRNLALEAENARLKAWKPDYSSPERYEESLRGKREEYAGLIGRYPEPTGALDARSVQVYEEPGFAGYRLSIRVYDGVHAYGILLVPKGIRAGERRPLVFVQHGLGGKPEDSLGVVANEKADAVYQRFGMRLAQRGYIVFAPMIATQDNIERTKLIRRGHPVGLIPVGMDVRKFGRLLDYLATLPYVDSGRFAFYGLSYGGYTALWAGAAERRFKTVICSGHFNDWNIKTTDLTQGTGYLRYPNVLDQYNFGMLYRFNHSDLASLIAPRAFMVEMGSQDGVVIAPRAFVDLELRRVEETYKRLGLSGRFAVARFDGPHRIDGREAFPFLDRTLHWRPLERK